jgi:tripartite-type tricarboxylate transporter receptor subunit TctC
MSARCFLSCVFLLAAFAVPAQAQQQAAARAGDYPTKTVRMIVGFAPGGATDLFARLIAQKLSERLHQQVIVENRPGAGGTLAETAVAKSPPDGYTLAVVSASHSINASLYRTLPYDAVKDFVPVAGVSSATNVLVVNPSVPAHTVAEFIALAKARPGSINFSSAGIGSSAHLAGELFKSMAGIDIVHVPYKGTSEAMRDLVSGQVQATVDAVSALLPLIQDGKLRALGVGDPQRLPRLPNVPTISEAGVPGYEVFAWVGVLAPAGTPPEIVQRLEHEITAIVKTPEIEKRFEEMGGRPFVRTSEQLDAHIKAEITKFARIIDQAGIPRQQ